MATFLPFSVSGPFWNRKYIKPFRTFPLNHNCVVVEFEEGSVIGDILAPHYAPYKNLEYWPKSRVFTKTYRSNHSYQEVLKMKRRSIEAQKRAGKWEPSGDELMKNFPNIDKELTDCFWDDGKPRQPCTLSLRPGKAGASVYLNDPELNAGINTAGDNLLDAMAKLEAYLAGGNPNFKPHANKKR